MNSSRWARRCWSDESTFRRDFDAIQFIDNAGNALSWYAQGHRQRAAAARRASGQRASPSASGCLVRRVAAIPRWTTLGGS